MRVGSSEEQPVVMRELVREKLAELRARTLNSTQLAAWAFEQFYKVESGSVRYEPGYEEMLADVIDELIFGDEAGFELGDQDLGALMERLQNT
jgi:hypothetical protein